MSFSHISHASMKTLVAGIAAAATLCTGAIATMQTANAADASTAPSIAGHAYNDLPVGNPDVTVTQIDNSALPATLRNPIGQNEGTNTPNDLSQNYYSADASTLNTMQTLRIHRTRRGRTNLRVLQYERLGRLRNRQSGIRQMDALQDHRQSRPVRLGNRRRSLRRTVVVDDAGTADTADDWFTTTFQSKTRTQPREPTRSPSAWPNQKAPSDHGSTPSERRC